MDMYSRCTTTKTGMLLFLFILLSGCSGETKFEFQNGDHVVYSGNALADCMQHDGWLETYLQASHPHHELVFRNLGFTGDKVAHRPRPHEGFGEPDAHLARIGADVIFAFFGYNESFDDNPDSFKQELSDWIDHTHSQRYNGETPPRIILFSPIAHENLNTPNLPDGTKNNRRLAAYTAAMAETAEQKDVLFVDLFHPSKELFNRSDEPLTINGVHLNSKGNREIARIIVRDLTGSAPRTRENRLEAIREAVLDKNWHWFNRYRATGGNDVWGSRAILHGNGETLQQELVMIDVMTANRDERIWQRTKGRDMKTDDSNVPPPVKVETNFEGIEEIVFLGGEEAIQKMTLSPDLEMNLFASEEMFPELVNPVQMQVDPQGRLWVAAWATYPKWEPLKEMNDRLLILEDTNGDGVADKSTTFAKIHNPTGFEFWNGGVIVVSAPDILFLKDTTGDNKADHIVRLLGGIDSADTHHTSNNLIYGPDGYIYYQRGVFHLDNVETPWNGATLYEASGLYRFNPRTFDFAFHVENPPNAHGISFDRWGYNFITDATSGSAFQVYLNEDNEFKTRSLLNHTVRPVTGNQVFSSSHFPEEYQNNFLIFNVIGFLGIKRYHLDYRDGIVRGTEIGDMFYSDDPNFRPTHGVIGSDGAFYVSDWHNPTVGHMQHNLRDPVRDHDHGRIYRVTAKSRPLMELVSIHDEPVLRLLELLRHPDNGIRHRTRIELSGRNTDEVIAAAQDWIKQFDHNNREHAHPLLEILWLHQQHNVVNRELLDQLRASPEPHARIAAERVAWFWDTPLSKTTPEISPGLSHQQQTDSLQSDSLDFTGRDAATLTIKAVQEEMRFDVTRFTVKPWQSVELTFDNPDYMPHNLLITRPGTADDVARLAIEQGASGFEKGFIPDSPYVLHATRLLGMGESQTIRFAAPPVPGEYPFVCTFPGHAELMRGVMVVVSQ